MPSDSGSGTPTRTRRSTPARDAPSTNRKSRLIKPSTEGIFKWQESSTRPTTKQSVDASWKQLPPIGYQVEFLLAATTLEHISSCSMTPPPSPRSYSNSHLPGLGNIPQELLLPSSWTRQYSHGTSIHLTTTDFPGQSTAPSLTFSPEL
jgi:hypothetical protein